MQLAAYHAAQTYTLLYRQIIKIAVSTRNFLRVWKTAVITDSFPDSFRDYWRWPDMGVKRFKRSALRTTETELNAIAAPASIGDKYPAAAIGIPTEL